LALGKGAPPVNTTAGSAGEQPDGIDPAALEILLASGVDPATAIEAAGIEPPPAEPPQNEPPKSGCLFVAVFLAVVFVWRSLSYAHA
jgi:hypothetical protein